jgi:predicted kinase
VAGTEADARASFPADLPADALVVLIGPSGSGKSTWAARHFRAHQVLSSDAFRALVAGDSADQSASRDAFRILHAVAEARTRRGLLTVVDATNLTVSARRALLRLAQRWNRPARAIVFAVPLERCLAQNARRAERRVPEEVIRRHVRQMAEVPSKLAGEGFVDIHVLRAPGRVDR